MKDPIVTPARPDTQTPAAPTVLPPTGGMRVPVHMFVSPEIMPGQDAIRELHQLACAEGLEHPIVAMPDVHYKGRNPAPSAPAMASFGFRLSAAWSRSTPH